MYMWSWSLSEAGRATLLAPLILHSCSRPGWYRMLFLQELTRQNAIEEDREHDSPIENVIRSYSLVAQANTITGLQQYIPCDTVSCFLGQARMAYQRLLSAANASQRRATSSNDSEDEAADIEDLEGFLGVSEEEEEEEEEEQEEAIDADDEGDEDDVTGELEAARSARRGKQPKYLRLQGLPNVHAGMHIKDNILEYATVMNCSVLAGELKHRYVEDN